MLTGITQNNDEADAHSVEFVAPATLEWRSLADDPLWQSEQKIEPTTPEIRIGVTASERLCREAAELRKQWQVDGNVTQAIRLFENAVEQYPDQWMAHYGLGDALLFRAEDGSAVSRRGQEALFRAAQLGPNQIEPALALAESLATTDIMLASKFYDYAVHIADAQPGPSLFPVGWQAGKCWAYAIQAEKAGLQASAIDAFRRALANREAPEYHGYSVDIPVANTALEQARRSPGITSVSTTPLTLPAWDAADRTIGKQQYIYRPDWISWLAMYQYILLRQ
jgi:tetratricopeptide (TPR) repeat protein